MPEPSQILHLYPDDCRPSQIEPLGCAGGMSGAQFWRMSTPRGVLALRRWPIEHPTPDGLRFIHAVLAHAAGRGITFLPVPIQTKRGDTFIELAGHLWELVPWVPGVADYDRNPTTEKLEAAMIALAGFHVATADFVAAETSLRRYDSVPQRHPSAITRHLSRLQSLQSSGIEELSRAITDDTWPDLAPLARHFLATLPRALPRAVAQLEPLAQKSLPLQPCIRDIWHDHVLFSGNEVTGLIDFGALAIDTPATDIARLLGSLSQSPLPSREGSGEGSSFSPPRSGEGLSADPTWHAGLAAYSSVRPLSHEELLAARALHISGTILAGCNWIRWIYVDARTFDNREQVIHRFTNILARL